MRMQIKAMTWITVLGLSTGAHAGVVIDLNAAGNEGDPAGQWKNEVDTNTYLVAVETGPVLTNGTASGSAVTFYRNPDGPGGGFKNIPIVGNNPAPVSATGFSDWTFEIWLRRTYTSVTNGNGEIHIARMGQEDGGSGNPWFALDNGNDYGGSPNGTDGTKLDYFLVGPGGFDGFPDQIDDIVPIVDPNDGPFTQLVFTYENSTTTLNVHVDGTQVRSHVLTTFNNWSAVSVVDDLDVFVNDIPNRSFPGEISVVRIYDLILDGATITNAFNAGPNAPPQPTGPPSAPTDVVLTDFALGDAPALVFTSVVGSVYSLEADPAGPPAIFEDVGAADLVGDGNVMMFFDPTEYSTSKTYRILATPPPGGPTNLVFAEDFDGAGYSAGVTLLGLSPTGSETNWIACCGTAQTPDVGASGFNGTLGGQRQAGSWGEGQIRTLVIPDAAFDFRVKFYYDASEDDGPGILGVVTESALNAPAGTPNFLWLANDPANGVLNFRTEGGPDDITSSFTYSTDTWAELNVNGTPVGTNGWNVSAQIRQYSGTTPGSWTPISLSSSNWNPATPFNPNWVTLNMIRNDPNTAVDDINLTVAP